MRAGVEGQPILLSGGGLLVGAFELEGVEWLFWKVYMVS